MIEIMGRTTAGGGRMPLSYVAFRHSRPPRWAGLIGKPGGER